MKFFKKTSVAITLTVLIVALCCVWGYTKAYLSSQATEETSTQTQRAGESNLNFFLNWIDDGANLFTMETKDTLARNNLDLSNTYGTLLAIKTVNYLNGQDIETYSKELFQEVDLGSKDMLLVIESSNQAWYLVYGSGLRTYADDNDSLVSLLKESLDDAFFLDGSDEGILSLSDRLADWCAENLPAVDNDADTNSPFPQHSEKVQILSPGDILWGILFTLLVNIWWIILLLVALNLADRYRLHQYIQKYPPDSFTIPPVFFRPFLFWHRPGSAWYRRMLYLFTEPPLDEDEEDYDESNGPQGFGGNGPKDDFHANDTTYGDPGGPYTGPGPDVGPDAANFQGGAGFQGNPEEAFRREHGSHGLWNNLWGLCWEILRSLQMMVQRFLRGGRM